MANLRDEIIALYDKHKDIHPRLKIEAEFDDQYLTLEQYPINQGIAGVAVNAVGAPLVGGLVADTIPTPELPVPEEPSLADKVNADLPSELEKLAEEEEPKPPKKKRASKPKVTMDDMLNVMRKFVTDYPDKRGDLREYIHGDFGVKTTDEMKKGDYPKVIKWCEENT